MILRDQFEAWFVRQPSFVSFAKNNSGKYCSCDAELAWQSFQAGHAANTVNAELLAACEVLLQFSRTEANCDTVAILHPSTSVDWHRGHRAALHLVRDKLEAAIKKTRGE